MPSCAVITCRARSQVLSIDKGGVSFHRFPKDPAIRAQWIAATGREDWIPTKYSTICSAHFTQNDYEIKKTGKKYLLDGAIPHEKIVYIQSLAQRSSSSGDKIDSKYLNESEDDQKIIKRIKLQDNEDNVPSTSGTQAVKEKSEEKSQFSSNASTPRKRKLKQVITTKDAVIKRQRKQIKKIQAQNRRLKKKIFKMDDIINDLENKFLLRHEDLSTLKNTNLQVEDLFARYITKNKAGEVNKQQYSQALRTFALTLHYYSPKAYNYVRDTFNTCLPHVRTLRKWYSSVDGEPGFTSESFAALEVKSKTTKYPIIAGLMIDEMAIRRRIEWDGKKLNGHVDIGSGLEGDCVTEAKEALVFLVTGINSKFKVPVAYFLVDGVTGVQRAELVKQCLEKVHETGVKIVSLTFDGCASNIAMVKTLGCNFENQIMTFPDPVTKFPIVAILDPAHMIKLIRNAFQVYKIFIDENGNKIEWSYLEQLNRLQEKEKFHLANKLRHRHIHYHNQKMKVKLATQLFSLSVADAIDFCREEFHIPIFRESAPTTRFLRTINNLFDIFNSRSMSQYGFKRALNEGNATEIFEYLDKAVKYISNLKCDKGPLLKQSQRKVGFLGFIGCAEAVRHFYKTLIATGELIFFPFYKTSQDHLELFFGNIRSHGGANNNPTARQFKAAYRKILVHTELKDFGNGNCTALENISFLNCTSIERINLTTQSAEKACDENINSEDDLEIPDNPFYSDFSAQVIGYIAGNVVHALIKKIKCEICVGALLSNSSDPMHKFINKKDKGGLIYPSSDVIKICKSTESVIRQHTFKLKNIKKNILVAKILRHFVGTNLFDDISFHQIDEFPTSNHVTDLIKVVIEKYLDIRIHFLLKTSIEKQTKRQLLNKYILFQGQ